MAIEKSIMRILKTKKTNSNALREYKQTITLNQMQREVIVGTLLGDACIPLDRGKARAARWKPTLHVKFVQTIARAEYIQHLDSVFYDFVGAPPRVHNTRGAGPARVYQSMWFRTFGHPDFKFYYDLFYPAHEYKGPRRKKRAKRARS